MNIHIIRTRLSRPELEQIAQEGYGEMVKGVVDLKQRVIALGGELHSDAESMLLQKGSSQVDLWGFNIYPQKVKTDRIAFTSMINVRPKQGNRSMEISDIKLREQIRNIIDAIIE